MVDCTQTSHGELSINEEADLVDRVRAGDPNACARLVNLFEARMMRIARRFMRCEDDCNDALQDAFISAFTGISRFEGNSRLSSWLHRITVNSCLMKLRSESSRRETSIDELAHTFDMGCSHASLRIDVHDPLTKVETDETCFAVRQAIDQLPETHRAVLLLRDIKEMDTATTAAILSTSESNVKNRLRRARQALCSRLEFTMSREPSRRILI